MIKPVFSEKSMAEAKLGKYTFLVDVHASKNEIKQIIKLVLGVDVTRVATLKLPGGKRRTMYGKVVTQKARKKAIVSLKKGQTIDLFEEKKQEKPKKKAKKS